MNDTVIDKRQETRDQEIMYVNSGIGFLRINNNFGEFLSSICAFIMYIHIQLEIHTLDYK